ncbi:50S ribosomal protein L24 [Patescibacteria group bacterium]|nr:50S ribosomal protein L24 [Patescibacteria group bacterium]
MKLKKGDKVQIIKGKDRVKRSKSGEKLAKGNQGKILQVVAEKGKIVVEGLNLRFKHMRPKKEGEKGQRLQFPAAMDTSNVMLVCPKCSKPTRVGYILLASDAKGKKKARICKKCKEAID